MAHIVPVILCGGSGSRLWPLSRSNHPKQFVELGEGRTLFKDTVARLEKLSSAPICVCNERHRFHVVDSLPPNSLVILEPRPRDTAPAIALSALAFLELHPDALILITPSDHHFTEENAFLDAVLDAASVADAGYIVTFGITPTWNAPDFGYIKAGEKLSHECSVVKTFVEKPGSEMAQRRLVTGQHYWNAGIFLVKPEIILKELEAHEPSLIAGCRRSHEGRSADGNIWRPARDEFEALPAISIDYAVMERSKRVAVRPVACGWSDMGSWQAFYDASPKDENDNAIAGKAILENCSRCHIRSTGRLVAALGVNDMTIVETQDAVLVASSGQDAQIRSVVKKMKDCGAPECDQHPVVHRPWGTYEVLSSGDRFQVKRIVVRPKASLSLQLHNHRAEHWIVVSGAAEVTRAGETSVFTANQSTYIPLGCPHRLRNPGSESLIIIEIQSGAYLGEDDIVRLEDIYHREGNE